MAEMHKERTLVIIKPDGVQRSLVGEILHRFERTGLKIAALKIALVTKDQEDKLWQHYNKNDEWFLKKGTRVVEDRTKAGLPIEKEPIEYGKDIIRALVKYMTAGPVVFLVMEGNQSIAVVRKLVGETEPATSDVGTIRGDLTIDSYPLATIGDRAVRNLIHCSENAEDAEREIPIWFTNEEIINYRLIPEAVLYDVNLDGILE